MPKDSPGSANKGTALNGFAFTDSALENLEGIQPKIRKQIRQRILKLSETPIPRGAKQLHGITDGESPIYRVRQGDYRILYCIRQNPAQIIILDIDHRKDVYKP